MNSCPAAEPLSIGVAFSHDDNGGFNLLLQAMPLDGKIVLESGRVGERPDTGPGISVCRVLLGELLDSRKSVSQ